MPYATAGLGGLTLCPCGDVRRLFIVRNNTTTPLFFGSETRYGHRVQGGLLFTY